MPVVTNERHEVVDCLAFRVVHQPPEIVAQEIGAGVLIRNSRVKNLWGESTVIVRRDVVLENAG